MVEQTATETDLPSQQDNSKTYNYLIGADDQEGKREEGEPRLLISKEQCGSAGCP